MTASMLHDTEHALAEVAERITPSVARIGRDRRGTALVVADGAVLTTSHHLRARTTTVTYADGVTVDAEVRAVDLDGDLVILDADTGGRPTPTWGDGSAVGVGKAVAAAGVEPGVGPRLALGHVSAVRQTFRGPRGRRITGALEHTAAVRRGGSGGPLVDLDGRVVGISTHRLRGGLHLAQTVDERFRRRLERLSAGADVTRPRLGVSLAPADVAARLRRSVGLEPREGLLVRGVEADGPAVAAGVTEGDLLARAGDVALVDVDALFGALDAAVDRIEIAIVRGADELELTVDLATADTAGTNDGRSDTGA